MQKLGEILVAAGAVAVPLTLFSVLAIALIVERVVFWFRVNRRQTKAIREVLDLYEFDPLLAVEKLKRNLDLPLGRIFLAAASLDEAEPDEIALAIDGATQAEIPVLKRFNNIFDTIITLSVNRELLLCLIAQNRQLSTFLIAIMMRWFAPIALHCHRLMMI